jgi:hypothetical protein
MKSIIKSLGTVALLSMFASTATALDLSAGDAGPLCGTIQHMPGSTVLEGAAQCSCSGEVTLSIAGGSYSSKPGSLVCESTHIYPSYDAYVPGGYTEIEADHFVNEVRLVSTCDTSGCSKILWIFDTGTAKCENNEVVLPGGAMTYKAVGTCEQGPKVNA